MAHLTDGIRIKYEKDGTVTLYDGEDKHLFWNASCDYGFDMLEEMIWLYKTKVENYKGDYQGMFKTQ